MTRCRAHTCSTRNLAVKLGGLLLLLLSSPADARPVRTWSWPQMAEAASGLLAGEVLEVAVVREIPEDQTPWKIPLLRMSAKVRILRMDPQAAGLPLAQGDVTLLAYKAIDPENARPIGNGPMFPRLSPGDTLVFPVRGTEPAEDGLWELIHDEDTGLLVPCHREGLPDVEVETGVDFLRAELAGVFVNGTYAHIHRAGRYLAHASLRAPRDLADLYDLFARYVGDDESRWLTIATATYCAMGSPRPSIADLRAGKVHTEYPRAPPLIASKALQHLTTEGLDDRIIAEAIPHLHIHYWGTAVTLAQNYPRHPTTVRLLGEALEADKPRALTVARHIAKNEDHPLIPAMVSAAARLLEQPATADHLDLCAACQIIRDYGDEHDFELLLNEISRAQKADRSRYIWLWRSARADSPRWLAVCAIVINDPRAFSEKDRFCDLAAFELQRVTGVDFGMASDQSPEQREAAIEKAKAWLEENAP